jgi:hypothetical protein
MGNRNNIGRAAEFSRAELGHMVSFAAGLPEEHIDAIWLAAVDDGFLTPEQIGKFAETQRFARHLSEAFAPHGAGGAS